MQTMSAAFVRKIGARVASYAANEDPMAAACNLVALVVAFNQPFYPLYVFWMVSGHIAPTFVTFLSTPFFLAVPAVARRSPKAGRALLVLTGLANTVLSASVFGAAAGAAIFLIPCALIAAIFFRPSERPIAFILIGMAILVYLGLGDAHGIPVRIYSPSEYRAFFGLNAVSAGMLTVFVGLIASGLLSRPSG